MDHEGGDGGVGGGHPELIPPRLCPAHLACGHGDARQEVDHRVVVVPAAKYRTLLSYKENYGWYLFF